MSTTLTYIHGIPNNEWADRSREVPRANYINYGQLTDGEMKIALSMEQANMLAAFYPEVKQYREIADGLRTALYSGIHGPSGERLDFQAAAYARKLISQARTKRGPAAKLLVDRVSALQGPDEPILPKTAKACGREPGKLFGVFNHKKQQTWEACMDQVLYQNLLNKKLEDSAHHILYAYEKNPNAAPNIVAAKTVLHQTAIYKWAEITGLSSENVNLWVRNGIMRGNTKQGIDPMQPEVSIDLMRTVIPEKNQSGVGVFLNPATIALLTKLFAAIAASVGATVTLLSSLKAKDQLRFQSSLGDMGLPPFGPEESDWLTDGQGKTAQQQGILSSNLLIPAAAAAGAYLILSKS